MVEYLRRAAGDDDGLDLDGDIAETTLADLGYDSISIVEMTLLIERELKISLPEDRANKDTTPREFVELVNELLPASI
ncbi:MULTISPECIES: acyl carrier protein [unclassified Micromonospora]|uniref:acyl carrier protein n=1 Tax=unclassified Micromonospora TaxID=2617518 RepID=UPI00197C101D|nr:MULTISPECIES: phosphopantetheine-binding protein [unclassified Micromonospora]